MKLQELIQFLWSTVIHKRIRKSKELHGILSFALLHERFQHRRAESALNDIVFDGYDRFDSRCHIRHESIIKRLHKAHIHDPGFNSFLRQYFRSRQRTLDHVSDCQERHILAAADSLGLPNFYFSEFFSKRDTQGIASRISEGDRSLGLNCGEEHVAEFLLVLRGHHHHSLDASQVGKIERSVKNSEK